MPQKYIFILIDYVMLDVKVDGKHFAKVRLRGKKKDAEEEVARRAFEKICASHVTMPSTAFPYT